LSCRIYSGITFFFVILYLVMPASERASPFPRHPDAVGGRVQSNLVIAYNTFIYKFIFENLNIDELAFGWDGLSAKLPMLLKSVLWLS
jgi:hypothetical protein